MKHTGRLAYLASSALALVSSAAAQITGGGDVLGGQTEEVIVGLFNPITIAEMTSIADVATFLMLLAVIYAFEANIIERLFLRIDKMLENQGGISARSDGYPTGTKLASIGIAYLTVNGVFFFIGPMLAGLMGLIGFLIVLLGHFGIFSPGSLWGGGGGGETTATDGGMPREVESRIGDIENSIGDIENSIQNIKGETEDARGSGNDEEARDAAERTEKVIKSLNEMEAELGQILDVEEKDLQNAIQEAQQVLEEEKKEEQALQTIQGRYRRVERTLEAVIEGCRNALDNNANLTNDGMLRSAGISGGGWSYAQYSDQGGSAYDVEGAGVKHAVEDLEEGYEQVQQLARLEEQEQQQVRDEFQRMQQEAKVFLAAHDIIQKLKQEIEQLEAEDADLEDLAQELGDRELLRKIEKEEEQDVQLEQQLKELMQKEEMIEQELEQALEMIEQELQIDTQELEQLQQELQETEQLESLFFTFGPDQGLGQQVKREGTQDNLNNYISRGEESLNGIEQGMQQIIRRKENEIEMLEELESELRSTVSSI